MISKRYARFFLSTESTTISISLLNPLPPSRRINIFLLWSSIFTPTAASGSDHLGSPLFSSVIMASISVSEECTAWWKPAAASNVYRKTCSSQHTYAQRELYQSSAAVPAKISKPPLGQRHYLDQGFRQMVLFVHCNGLIFQKGHFLESLCQAWCRAGYKYL